MEMKIPSGAGTTLLYVSLIGRKDRGYITIKFGDKLKLTLMQSEGLIDLLVLHGYALVD